MSVVSWNYWPIAGQLHLYQTAIAGIYLIRRPIMSDQRGFFSTPVSFPELESVLGRPFIVRQMNYSHSEYKVLRGLHLNGWNKLITVTRGIAECAMVDVRPDSPTFGQHFVYVLDDSDDATSALFVARGIANSFLARTDVDYVYLVDKAWEHRGDNDDLTINPFDPKLELGWQYRSDEVLMSPKDRYAPTLSEMRASGKLNGYKI